MFDYGRKLIIDIAMGMAATQANTCCAFWFYQPRMPKALDKLRKTK